MTAAAAGAAKIVAPFARLPCNPSTDCVAVGDGTIAFTSARGTLAFADADGAIVDELEMPEPGLCTDALHASRDGSLAGCSGYYRKPIGILLARRGDGVVKCLRMDFDQPAVQAVAGVGALVSHDSRIFVVRHDLSSDVIRVPDVSGMGGRDTSVLTGPYWWNHDVLVMTAFNPISMEEAESDHEYLCIGGDGVVRFRGAGLVAIPVDDELALVWERNAVHAIDRSGARVGTHERATLVEDKRRPLARVGDDVIVKIDMYDPSPGLLRLSPRALANARWECPFPTENARFSQGWPICVGRHVAIYLCGPEGGRGVFLVDADSGGPVTMLPCEQAAVGGLLAVGDDAVATKAVYAGQQHTDVWSELGTSSPQRLRIEHEGQHHAICSPRAGVLAFAFGDNVCLYRVS